MRSLDLRVFLVSMERPGRQGRQAFLVLLVKEGLLDHEGTKERGGTLGHQDLKAFRGQKGNQDGTVCQGYQELQDPQGRQASPSSPTLMNRLWELALGLLLGDQVVLVQRVSLEYLEHLEHLERGEFLEARESEEIQD